MQLTRSLLALCLFLFSHSTEGARPNDQNFTAADVKPYGCGEECQENIRQGMKRDRQIFQGYPFDHDFYHTAANFSNANPGDVLKLEAFNDSSAQLSVPLDLTTYKMQYVSIGLHEEKVPATAFITLPYKADYGTKPRLLAFAHGTIGTMPSCPPTSSYNFYNYYTWQTLAVAGYAVVGTDYAGLGNNHTMHKYVNPVLNGEDVYWSVIAARRAFPNTFTEQWASYGHSQGGGAIWGLSENPRVASNESGKYVGGVAVAPAPRVYDLQMAMLKAGEEDRSTTAPKYAPLIAEAIKSVIPPSATVEGITEAARERLPLASLLQLCIYGSESLFLDLPNKGMNKSAYMHSNQLQSFQQEFGAALGKRGYEELLVLQGTDDQTVNYNVTEEAYHTACAAGNNVRLSLYPGLDHRPVLTASAPEFLGWLDERFRGVSASQQCVLRRVHPLVTG